LPIWCLQLLPNDVLVSGSDDKSLKFWNINSFNCIKTIDNAHQNYIWCLQLLPNDVLVSGSECKSLKFWISILLIVSKLLIMHIKIPFGVFNYYQMMFLFLDPYDKSLKFWNINSFNCIKTIDNAHQDSIWCLQLLPNDVLVSGSDDKSLKFWNINSFNCIKTIDNAHQSWI
jgi:WD40 repeat protein